MKFVLAILTLMVPLALEGSISNRHYKVLNFCCHSGCTSQEQPEDYPEIVDVP